MALVRKVRPRWVWGGTFTVIAAMVLVGVANVVGSVLFEMIGIVLVLAGGATALLGGVMRDVHGVAAEVEQEPEEAAEGERRRGVTPGEHVHDPAVVTEVDTRPRPGLLPGPRDVGAAGLGGLFLVGAWLLVGRSFLGVPFEVQTKGASLREVMVGVVVVLAAIALHQHGPALWASAVCAAGGLVLVLCAVTLTYGDSAERVSELISGIAVIVFAAATLLRHEQLRAVA
jgi:hypothetical protein